MLEASGLGVLVIASCPRRSSWEGTQPSLDGAGGGPLSSADGAFLSCRAAPRDVVLHQDPRLLAPPASGSSESRLRGESCSQRLRGSSGVQSEWNGWRTAGVKMSDLHEVHWFQPTGAPRPLVHGYVSCASITAGELPHNCTGTVVRIGCSFASSRATRQRPSTPSWNGGQTRARSRREAPGARYPTGFVHSAVRR